MAEWLAWNWWRLRWEPRSASPDWALAHRMSSIGEGYVWPNIEIFSDGVRTALISSASIRPDAKPFRYLGTLPTVVLSSLFEAAIDAFMPRILGRLSEERVAETNLNRLWRDVLCERGDPYVAKRRRLEALMGRDPDSVEDDTVEMLLADAGRLGEAAIDEVAAERAQAVGRDEVVLTAASLEEMADAKGYDASIEDSVRLSADTELPSEADVPAWRLGSDAALALRLQERLGVTPIGNGRLAKMAGAQVEALVDRGGGGASLSFALDGRTPTSRVVLRSKWESGRRFDLARLVGDRLLNHGGTLHPATRAYTYRQKAQRSFAAELLSPFDAVDEMLDGDISLERQQDVADHFNVSPMTINALLKNHRRLEREPPEEDFDGAAA